MDLKNEWVRSADGTRIGYRQTGKGPGLILVHGALQSSLNFTELAKALSSDFTVYIPDRRGRGLSGPYRPGNNLVTEAHDLVALIHQTKAVNVFGLSAGAIITLQAALLTSSIEKAALYEPPLAIKGHPFDALDKPYNAAMNRQNYGSAFVAILKGTGDDSFLSKLPAFITAPLINRRMKAQMEKPVDDEVPLQVLVQNFYHDRVIVKDTEQLMPAIKNVRAAVMLLGGTKSPAYFSKALDSLQQALPAARRVYLEQLGHLGADNSERPLQVAKALLSFLKE